MTTFILTAIPVVVTKDLTSLLSEYFELHTCVTSTLSPFVCFHLVRYNFGLTIIHIIPHSGWFAVWHAYLTDGLVYI